MGKAKKGPKKGTSDVRRKTQPQKVMNPFEVHVNRQKFQILGRKLKADRGLPGVSRAKALKKRKATLLQEYKLQDKSNRFVDRRIGESNSAMTAEDKMTARFAAERMRSHNKKEMYNLADDEVLTHRGQTLNEIEKFDDPRSDDDYDEETGQKSKGNLDAHFVGDAHFGGGLFTKTTEDSSKSRKNMIDQLIAESKKRKAEQQKLREQTTGLTEKLDTEWRDLLPVIKAVPKSCDVEKPKPDSYDTLMRELRFEARGKPTDKLKSDDQIAREEKEKLEELEAARLRRMRGVEDTPAVVPKHRSADDLDDNFAIDDDMEKSADFEEEMEQENGAQVIDDKDDDDDSTTGTDEEEGDDEGDNAVSMDEEDGSIDDDKESEEDDLADLKNDSSDEDSTQFSYAKSQNDIVEDDSNIMEINSELEEKYQTPDEKGDNTKHPQVHVDKIAAIREDLRKRKELMEAARKELPFTYEVPESYEELQKMMVGRSPDHQGVIVERMIKCTHPSLSSGNKEKLSHLFGLLMERLHDAAIGDQNENVWAVLDRFAPSLFDLANWCPDKAAEAMRHVLREKQQEYRSKRRKFPGVDTIVYFKLISLLFPTSDFRHPVVTPALVFMGQILSKCRIESRQDVARGLLLVSLFLEFTALSKRFSPESVNFLRNLLYLSTKLPSTIKVQSTTKLPQVRPMPPVSIVPKPRLVLQPNVKNTTYRNFEPNEQLKASDLIGNAPLDDAFCINSVFISLKTLSSMVSQLSSQPACRHIFSPISPLLQSLREEKWLPQKVGEEIEKLQKSLQSIDETPLHFIVAPPKPINPLILYDPKLEQVYADGKQRRPGDFERQEREKLLHKIKRERKGAMREIRRDRDFLTNIRLKQQLKSDAVRRAKVKEIYGDASNQQGELKKFDKLKTKPRKK